MDGPTARRQVATLAAAYPLTPMTDETFALYARYLADLDKEDAETAVEEIILDSPALPTIAEVRRRALEINAELPTPLEAWVSIVTRPGGEPVKLHPLAKEVCDLFGGAYTIRTSDQPTIMRAQFLRAYGERRDEELRRDNVARFRRKAA